MNLDSTKINAYIEDNEDNVVAVLNIRNLSKSVHQRLRIRAAKHGRSMEAEARAILTEACEEQELEAASENLPGLIAELYRGVLPTSVVEDLFAERKKEAKREI